MWVSRRLSLALDVIKEVQEALERGDISLAQALIIGQLSPKEGKLTPYFVNQQRKFLNLIK